MAEGITGSFDLMDSNGRYKLTVHYRQDYDIAENRSAVSVTGMELTALSPYGYYGTTHYPSGTVSIDGKTAVSFDGNQGFWVDSQDVPYLIRFDGTTVTGNVSVLHEGDGSKTVKFALSVRFYHSWGSFDITGEVDIPLTTISRASKPSLSVPSIEMGRALTIYTNRKNPAFTHTISYWFGSASGTIATSVGDSADWIPPYDLAYQIPTDVSGSGIIYCDTYNGSTLVGTESVSFTLVVPDDAYTKPSMNPVFSPAGSLPDAFSGLYVQGKTALEVVFNPSSSYSPVASCSLTIGGKTYTGDTVVTDLLIVSGDIAYTAAVTDKRGYRRIVNGSIHVEDYSQPRLENTLCQRCNANGTEETGGTYLHLKFTKVFSSVAGKNGCTAAYRVKPEGGSYGSETALSGNSYDKVLSGVVTDPEKAYQVQVILRDTVGEAVYMTYDLPSQFHTMHLKAGGRGIAFGKKATKDLFACAMDAEFGSNGQMRITESANGMEISLNGGTVPAVKMTSKTLTIDANADVTLFSQVVPVLAVVNKTAGKYPIFIPYFYNGNTKARVLNFSSTSYLPCTSETVTVEIYYLET